MTKQTLVDAGLWDPEQQTYAPMKYLCFGTGVTAIEPVLFRGCASLNRVELPSSIVEIGYQAFMDCTSLNAIRFPNCINGDGELGSQTSVNSQIFANCTSLSYVKIPGTLRKIPSTMFSGCSGLATVVLGPGIETIDSRAFFGCPLYGGILYIPSSVKTINGFAFQNGTFSEVMLCEGLESIGNCVFKNCTQLRSLTIPSSIDGDAIGDDAFVNCTSLDKIVFKNKNLDQVKAMPRYPWGLTT